MDHNIEEEIPMNGENGCNEDVPISCFTDNNERAAHYSEPEQEKSSVFLFKVDDTPPWHLSILFGLQHFLTMVGGTIAMPLLLAPALCIEEDDPATSSIISTVVFVSGIVTMLQTTFGVRLPIVQGGSPSFLVSAFAILNQPEWKCPAKEAMSNMTYEDKTELWQSRMREVQGAIVVASVFEVVLGLTGTLGLILRFITPLTIAPAIAMVGISVFAAAGDMAGKHWGIAGLAIVLVLVFALYLRNVKFPIPNYQLGKGWRISRFEIFALLPIMLTIVIVWVLCGILTVSGALAPGSPARTDNKIHILYEAPWFRVPYPCQWGLPTVSAAGVFGMLAAVIASAIESIGDYYACARLAGAKPPPIHAINRGLAVEGIGCICAGFWGSGNATTSYSENIGAIGITKVGSRRVIQCTAAVLLFFGAVSKFGSLLVSIPEPLIGGIFCVMFGMIVAAGLANLQFFDLNSSRNMLILGFSIFFSLLLAHWMGKHSISTGSDVVDQILTVLLSTTMFTAGVVGFVLDNTVPGTPEERGLHWLELASKVEDEKDQAGGTKKIQDTYDVPFITPWLKRKSWSAYIPFLPTYQSQVLSCGPRCCRKTGQITQNEDIRISHSINKM